MKMKIFLTTSLLFSTMMIAACTPKTEQTPETTSQTVVQSVSSEVQQEEATISLQVDGEEVENKTVTFVAGESLYQVMQANFDLVDQDGFITSINGQAQDEAAQKYWMYDVNGEMALVGAKDLILEPGDHVEFKLEEMK